MTKKLITTLFTAFLIFTAFFSCLLLTYNNQAKASGWTAISSDTLRENKANGDQMNSRTIERHSFLVAECMDTGIAQMEQEYSYGFRNLEIWVKNNGEIVVDGEKWRFNSEGIYSAYENYVDSMLENFETNLTHEQLEFSSIYKQADYVRDEYNLLKSETAEIVAKIASEQFWHDDGNIFIEGLIAKETIVGEYIQIIDSFTSEQKGDVNETYQKLLLAIRKIDYLKSDVLNYQNSIEKHYIENDISNEILKEGLIACDSSLATLFGSYDDMTSEQKFLLLSYYKKISSLQSMIVELRNECSKFVTDTETIIASIEELGNNYDGILRYEDDVSCFMTIHGSFTIEQKVDLGVLIVENKLRAFESEINEQKQEIESLLSRFDEIEKVSSSGDGLIMKIPQISQLLLDMKDNVALTTQQVLSLKYSYDKLSSIQSIAEQKKTVVDKYLQDFEEGILYEKRRYDENTLNCINNVLCDISKLTNEQISFLQCVIVGIESDLSESLELKKQIADLHAEAAQINIWQIPPEIGVLPSLDSAKFRSLSIEDSQAIVSIKAKLKAGNLTDEQSLDLAVLLEIIEEADILRVDFLKIGNLIIEFNEIDIDVENVLIGKKSSVFALYNKLNMQTSDIKQHLICEIEILLEYIEMIKTYESQVIHMNTLYTQFLSFGDSIMFFGDRIDEFLQLYNGEITFSTGNYITGEQQLLLLTQKDYFENKKNRYFELHKMVFDINNEHDLLELSDTDLYLMSKKQMIIQLLKKMESSILTSEQKYELSSSKLQCTIYLEQITAMESCVENAKNKTSALLNDISNIIANRNKILQLQSEISEMKMQVKIALKLELSGLEKLLTKGYELLEEIDKLKSDVSNLMLVLIDDILSHEDDIINKLLWLDETATNEQQIQLKIEYSYLSNVRKEIFSQNKIVTELVLKVKMLPNEIKREHYDLISSLIDEYEALLIAQKNIFSVDAKDKLYNTYGQLKFANLSNIDDGIFLTLNDTLSAKDIITLTSKEIINNQTMLIAYNNLIINAKVANKITHLYSLALYSNLNEYVLKSAATVKIKLPNDFSADLDSVVYIRSDSTCEKLEFEIVDGYLVFSIMSTGIFAIVSDEFSFPYLLFGGIFIGVAVICASIYLVMRKLHKAKLKLEYDDNSVKVTVIWPVKNIKNLALYVNNKLAVVDNNPISVYYLQNVADGSVISIYYDFYDHSSEFPQLLKRKTSLRLASKKVKLQ